MNERGYELRWNDFDSWMNNYETKSYNALTTVSYDTDIITHALTEFV